MGTYDPEQIACPPTVASPDPGPSTQAPSRLLKAKLRISGSGGGACLQHQFMVSGFTSCIHPRDGGCGDDLTGGVVLSPGFQVP